MDNTIFIDLGKENEKAILTMANSGLFKLTIGVSKEDCVTPIIKVDVRRHRKGIWPCGEIVYPYNCLKCYTHDQDGSFENLQSICKFISDAEEFTKRAKNPATRVEYDIVNLYGMAKYKMHTHFYKTRFPGIYMMRVYKKYEDNNGDIKMEFTKGYKGLIILTEDDIDDFIENRTTYRFLGDYVLRTYSDRMLYI